VPPSFPSALSRGIFTWDGQFFMPYNLIPNVSASNSTAASSASASSITTTAAEVDSLLAALREFAAS
jgi:hypothetical protein